MSDATYKTKHSKKSAKSNKSGRSDRSDKRQRYREHFEVEKQVDKYRVDKNIEEFEKDYEYQSEEESIYRSFVHEPKQMPLQVTKNFSMKNETSQNKKIVRDTLKRFNEKTHTLEFIIKFQVKVERTNESTISQGTGIPGEILDQKERRRFVRKEIMAY